MRAHKVSELNAEGPYKPVYPIRGAWQIEAGHVMNVYVSRRWHVEYWNGLAWVRARSN